MLFLLTILHPLCYSFAVILEVLILGSILSGMILSSIFLYNAIACEILLLYLSEINPGVL